MAWLGQEETFKLPAGFSNARMTGFDRQDGFWDESPSSA